MTVDVVALAAVVLVLLVASAVLDPAALRSRLGRHRTPAVVGNGTHTMSVSSREAATAGDRPQLVLTSS